MEDCFNGKNMQTSGILSGIAKKLFERFIFLIILSYI